MTDDINRQDLLLTRDAIRQASQQVRFLYGAVVREFRERSRLTQDEVAERSGVSQRTIRNIESGAVAGQAEKLIKIFIALGVDLDGRLYTVDVQRHLRMLGSLITRIDEEHRDDAVMRAAVMLADEIGLHPSPELADMTNVYSLSTARLIKDADELLHRTRGQSASDDDLDAVDYDDLDAVARPAEEEPTDEQ